jgi:hypothetical protein
MRALFALGTTAIGNALERLSRGAPPGMQTPPQTSSSIRSGEHPGLPQFPESPIPRSEKHLIRFAKLRSPASTVIKRSLKSSLVVDDWAGTATLDILASYRCNIAIESTRTDIGKHADFSICQRRLSAIPAYGFMFWFRWKRFSGSYCFLICTRRS